MTALDFDRDVVALFVCGFLRAGDGRGRLEVGAEDDLGAVGHAAEDAAGVVRLHTEDLLQAVELTTCEHLLELLFRERRLVMERTGTVHVLEARLVLVVLIVIINLHRGDRHRNSLEAIVILGAERAGGLRPVADLHGLDRTDRHHSLREARVELIEDRLTDAGRHVVDEAGHDATGAVLLLTELEDALVRCLLTGRGRHVDTGKLRHLRVHRDAEIRQHLRRHGTTGDTCEGLATAGATAAAVVTETVLLIETVIGVARTEHVGDVRVVLTVLVTVSHHHRDRRTGRLSLEDTGEDLDPVVLLSLGGLQILARLPPVHIRLDVLNGQWEAGRAAIDDDAECRSV